MALEIRNRYLEKVNAAKHAFSTTERNRFSRLRDYLRNEKTGTETSKSATQCGNIQDIGGVNIDLKLANELDQLLGQARKVNSQVAEVEKAPEKDGMSASKLKKFTLLLDQYIRKREDLFTHNAQSAQRLRDADRKSRLEEKRINRKQSEKQEEEKKARKIEARKRKKKQMETIEREKIFQKERAIQKEKEREAKEQNERRIQERRYLQQMHAGDASAKNLWFQKMKVTEHAIFRWNDRVRCTSPGILTLTKFLQAIDEGDFLYQLQQNNDKTWEVRLFHYSRCFSSSDVSNEENKGIKSNIREKVVLILNEQQDTIITMLRDDRLYKYKKSDRSYAPRGKIYRTGNWEQPPRKKK